MREVEVIFVGPWGLVCPMESMGWNGISCSEESSDVNAVESTGSVDAMKLPSSDTSRRVPGSCAGPSVGVNVNAGGAEGVET